MYTLRYRLIHDEDDSDSEDGHFSPVKNPNMKVYSCQLTKDRLEKSPSQSNKIIRGGQILAALKKPKIKVSSQASLAQRL